MEKRTLIPRSIIKVKGKLSYSESLGAWNTIRFKKELVKEFPQLAEKRSKFSYQIKFCRDVKEFESMLKEIKKGENMPMLLWVYRDVEG